MDEVKLVLEQTLCDGVLIARGALGNPWFFKQALDPSFVVTLEERIKVLLEHAAMHIAQYGDRGIMTFRKHVSWYFKSNRLGIDIPGIKDWRAKLVRIDCLESLQILLNEMENAKKCG